MKPTVRYFNLNGEVRVGLPAYLCTEGHPSGRVTPGRTVRTSDVVAYDPATGRIETQNTIYIPREPNMVGRLPFVDRLPKSNRE